MFTVSATQSHTKNQSEMSQSSFVALLLMLIVSARALADTHYIKPMPSTPCPDRGTVSCLTLSQVATKSNNFFMPNTSLVLLPGNHNFRMPLMIRNITNLLMLANSTANITSISCSHSAVLILEHIVGHVHISGLSLIHCSVNITLTKQFTMKNCDLIDIQHNTTGMVLNNVNSASIVSLKATMVTPGNQIQINNSVVSIVNSLFSGWSIKENCSILYIHNSVASLTKNTFSNNRVHGGSIVQIDENSTVTISGTLFQNNTCLHTSYQGCAVNSIHSVLSINDSVFINNSVHGEHSQGGALSSVSGIIYVTNCTFVSNSAGDCGGAVCAQFTSVSINNSIFSSNRADHNGGAVSVDVSPSTIVVSNSRFFNNTADDGGGMYVMQSNTTLENNTFFRCRGRGGAMQLYNGSISIVSCKFIENEAQLDSFGRVDAQKGNVLNGGGAMFLNDCSVAIWNSSFVKNSAKVGMDVLLQSLAVVNNSTLPEHVSFDAYAGGIFILLSSLSIDDSKFIQNEAVVKCQYKSISHIMSCRSAGGAIVAYRSNVTITRSEVMGNKATVNSGIDNRNEYDHNHNFINITQYPRFNGNISESVEGGAFCIKKSTLLIDGTNFVQNSANVTRSINNTNETSNGGAIYFFTGTIEIHHSTFHNNTATENGGAISASDGRITINEHSNFTNNRASNEGGAVWYKSVGKREYTIVIENSTFVNNTAQYLGGALSFTSTTFISNGYLHISNNSGYSVVTAQNSVVTFNGHTTFVNNTGSVLFATTSNVTFKGYINIMYTNSSQESSETQLLFAPLHFTQSDLTFTGNVNILHNNGIGSGAISISEGRITVNGEVQIRNNTASLYGGAIFAYKCEMTFKGKSVISENVAFIDGGGVYADTTTISVIEGSLHFHKNSAAKNGGGIFLESNSKIQIIKSIVECKNINKTLCLDDVLCYPCNPNPNTWIALDFIGNSADNGGAIYVEDDTYSDICIPLTLFKSHTSECFIQIFARYITILNYFKARDGEVNLLNIHFHNNSAIIAGNTIFGGLLDRCLLSRSTEINKYFGDNERGPLDNMPAYQILANITNLQSNEIQEELASHPVRVCFCRDDQPDCSYLPPTVYVRKGEHFRVTAVAVDQVMNTVSNSSIHSVVSVKGGLGEGQSTQLTGEGCTQLKYSIFSPHDSEQVLLYAEGPCKDRGISRTTFNVSFLHCPIGFKDSDTNCECDPAIFPNYTTDCSIDSEKVLRKDNAWIDYVNTSDYSGFLLHHHCPFDYCVESTWINLNTPIGTDDQCAFNRTGKLCGSCKDDLSLVLGTSQCMSCSNDWLGFMLVFVIIGIALVAFLLVCNITVDVGTINGFILYANIVTTNSAIFIPFKTPNILSVFIAWLNLDFGFEICFFDGMDGYAKTWLQFVFPLYTILLVVTIIVVVERSKHLTGLLRSINKNPVATLATLILLSYTKLLRTIITVLSYTKVKHQYGLDESVWLMDADIQYLKRKHIYIFIAATLFLIMGLIYTSVLLFWQWIFKWVRNTKLFAFMDAYQNPYNVKHRYWSGLLLLVRLVLYTVSALNVTGDPSVNILSIICVVAILLLLKEFISTKIYKQWMVDVSGCSKPIFLNIKIYKEWTLNALETSILFNILIFAAATLYVKETHSQQTLAYISVSIVFATFLGVLAYHTYVFVVLKLLNRVRDCCSQSRARARVHNTRNNDSPEIELLFEAESCTEVHVDTLPQIVNTEEERRVDNNVCSTEMKEFCSEDRLPIGQGSRQHNDEDITKGEE